MIRKNKRIIDKINRDIRMSNVKASEVHEIGVCVKTQETKQDHRYEIPDFMKKASPTLIREVYFSKSTDELFDDDNELLFPWEVEDLKEDSQLKKNIAAGLSFISTKLVSAKNRCSEKVRNSIDTHKIKERVLYGERV